MSVTTNTPFGFRYYKSLLGTNTQEVLNTYIWNDNTVAIYESMPVSLALTGAAAAPVNGYKRIVVADAQNAAGNFVGIARGVKYTDLQGNVRISNTFPANAAKAGTVVEVLVSDDSNNIYMVQASAAVTNANMSNNARILNPGTGGSDGASTSALDAGNIANTATLPLKIVGYVPPEKFPGNVNTAAFPVMLVKLNNHAYGSAMAGF